MGIHSITNRLLNNADLATELQPLQSLVEIFGDQRVLIENHCGIRKYTTQEIVISAKNADICVAGDGLHIVLMTKERLVIQGGICNISLYRGA